MKMSHKLNGKNSKKPFIISFNNYTLICLILFKIFFVATVKDNKDPDEVFLLPISKNI